MDTFLMPETKTCRTCKIEKELSLFGNDKSSKDGKRYQCKSCDSKQKKQYRLEHLEEIREKDRKRRPAKGRQKLTKEEKRERAIWGRANTISNWCPQCKLDLPVNNFGIDYERPNGCRSWCVDCQKKYMKIKRDVYLPRKNESAREVRANLRLEVLQHYSSAFPSCACCGEDRIEFLSIDHIDGGGTQHKKQVRHVYNWIKKNNFPQGFRVLCHNCNQSRGAYGYCPHEKEREELTKAA